MPANSSTYRRFKVFRAALEARLLAVAVFVLYAHLSVASGQPFSRAIPLRSPDDPKVHSNFNEFGSDVGGLTRFGEVTASVVAIGAFGDYQEAHQGLVYLYNAANGEFIHALRNPRLDTGGQFGRAIAAVGDLDADGFEEFLIGAPLESAPGGPGNEGAAYLWSTNAKIAPSRIAPPVARFAANFGDYLTSIPDVNTDGVGDLGITAYNRHAYVFSGQGRNLALTLPGTSAPAYSAVQSAIGIPDVNSDGAGDIVVNAIRPNAVLPLECFSGATGERLWSVQFERLLSLAPISDMNDDGVGDILAGCQYCTPPGQPKISGIVWILSGITGETIRSIMSTRPQAGLFGASVLALPDLDSDGVPEIAVGARNEAPLGGVRSGVVYILSGASGEALQILSSTRPVEFGWFGHAIASVPDANGDGRPELAVTANGEMLGFPGRQAYLFHSCRADYNADARLDSADVFDFLAAFFAGSADYNTDSRVDSQDFFDFLAEFFGGC